MKLCSECGKPVTPYRNPALTVDIIIEYKGPDSENHDQLVFITRGNEPLGTALPGGFVDYGERVEEAAVREAREETGLDVELVSLLGVYSDPGRDPRGHTVSIVYIARATGELTAGDDASGVFATSEDNLPHDLVFDHDKILKDYINY